MVVQAAVASGLDPEAGAVGASNIKETQVVAGSGSSGLTTTVVAVEVSAAVACPTAFPLVPVTLVVTVVLLTLQYDYWFGSQ